MHALTRIGATGLLLAIGLACQTGNADEPVRTPDEAAGRESEAGPASDAEAMMMEKKKAAMAAEAGWRQAMADAGSGGAPDAKRCWVDARALGGYDPVSYRAARPLRGVAELSARHEGATYVFATPENRDRFLADPERFVPRYAGWCAMSLALGAFVCPDYENYKIEEGELLLFETTVFTNGRTVWNQDPARHRAEADRHYLAGAAR